jgi:hypothetical protein
MTCGDGRLERVLFRLAGKPLWMGFYRPRKLLFTGHNPEGPVGLYGGSYASTKLIPDCKANWYQISRFSSQLHMKSLAFAANYFL